jgi:hypothetical protein
MLHALRQILKRTRWRRKTIILPAPEKNGVSGFQYRLQNWPEDVMNDDD